RGDQPALPVRPGSADRPVPAARPAWHRQAHQGLEPARPVPLQQVPAPAAGPLLGGEVAGLIWTEAFPVRRKFNQRKASNETATDRAAREHYSERLRVWDSR